ncbi:tripartite tricarboxylate transporter substrate-binding protein [Alsobacter sp. SYSU BS001988]
MAATVRGRLRHAAVAVAAGFGMALLAPLGAGAQDYPAKPITLVVPYAAGGPSDVIARLVGQNMSASLGQQIIIENVAGAGGTTGAERVAKSAPDGYTLLIHHVALAAGASMYKLRYDTTAAFSPIGLINYGPFVLTARADYPPGTAAEILAKLKADGPKVNVAHAGVGSGSHLCGLMLNQALGVSFTYIPYKGTGPAMNDLVAGQVDVLCDQTTNAIPQIEGGKIKAYAVTSGKRLEQLPKLPSLAEAGLQGFEVTVWHGLYAPAQTPAPVVAKLNAALQKALADETILKRFSDLGTLTFPADQRTPAALDAYLKGEVKKWADVIQKAGFKAE